MFYVGLMILAAVVTIAMTKPTPRAATRLGLAAVVVAVVAVAIAEATGNMLLFYFGALAAPFGVLVLLATWVGVWRRQRDMSWESSSVHELPKRRKDS